MPGPGVRTDVVEVYVFRRAARHAGAGVEFLQLRRTRAPLAGSWQPVMGHAEPGETAARAALRELREETGFAPVGAPLPAAAVGRVVAFWQLELVNTFFLASIDSIVLSAGFAAEVATPAGAGGAPPEPVLDDAHDAARWVRRDRADRAFLWPGQRAAVRHIVDDLLPADSETGRYLRIDPARD